MYDVCIIGGGVIGSALARELSRYNVKAVLVEAENDVCTQTSGANSGIVHAGYDAPNDTLMAYYNVLGSKMFQFYAKVLDVPYQKTGSLVVSLSEQDDRKLFDMYNRGRSRGINVLLLNSLQALEMEPKLFTKVRKALYAPDAAIIDPFELVFALHENAKANGVEFKFNFKVTDVVQHDDYADIYAGTEKVSAKLIVNCAGNYGGDIAKLFGDDITLKHRLGEYVIFDKSPMVKMPIFGTPTAKGKGVLVCPTVTGNFFVGPTGNDIPEYSTDVTVGAYDELRSRADSTLAGIPWDKTISSFAGVRALSESGDFIIGPSNASKLLYNIIGICSPGLSAAPAIASKVASSFGFSKKQNFNASRKSIKKIKNASFAGKNTLIAQDKSYGNIVCRCETVSEAEVVEAIKRGATTVDGVKKRTRAGMGRCQGGFCLPVIVKILARELGISTEEVLKNHNGSNILMSEGL